MGDYGYRESRSPHVNLVWWAEIDEDSTYVDAANEFWGLSFGEGAVGGAMTATLIGPTTDPRTLDMRAGERAWGVELAAHVFVRGLAKSHLVGELRPLDTDGAWFELAGIRLPIPDLDGLEYLVGVLLRQGVLVADHRVAAALSGDGGRWSERTLHRSVAETTGLGRKRIEQLRRARTAYALLQEGLSLAEAANAAGFADQAHMTRAFTALAGQSPARILAAEASPFESRP